MGLGSLIGPAIEAARLATESLGFHGLVSHEAWLSQDARGLASYEEPVTISALIAEGEQQIQTRDGRSVRVRAILTFFPSADGEAPPDVQLRDRFTLPSGLTGPAVEIPNATVDPVTGRVALRVVWLG